MTSPIYRSPNGADWLFELDDAGSTVVHRANPTSGGTVTRMPTAEFLQRGGSGPEV